ncbi:hypothetical protein DH2020_044069 [Rehmannia glutinosa]|uniref:Rhodanese domain-containing protein n=1 Tax=Rehmannia glutinosa TaxID=99300 RepID=A0ABR0UJR3_REHGL
MDSNGVGETATHIRQEIASLQKTKAQIEDRISALQARLSSCSSEDGNEETNSSAPRPTETTFSGQLSADMIYRYSRHLLLPSFGVEAQANLLKSSVLVIGAGGLGAPALLYLAACGVGRVGIVDHDVVELNNLHRQIIHTEAYIGRSKVESAAAACRAYDIVVDATDNVPSRYMINDCCVVLGKLTVYNYNGGPCYRCLFPTPPPTTACQRCADSGVLGALEAIKVASAVGEPLSGRMLLLDALSARICVSPLKLDLLPAEARITSKDYNDRISNGETHVLVDVRPAHHYKIISLPKSLNIPFTSLEERLSEIPAALAREKDNKTDDASRDASLYVICRRGNDSQRAVEYLHKMGFTSAKDIIGGLESWAHDVDPQKKPKIIPEPRKKSSDDQLITYHMSWPGCDGLRVGGTPPIFTILGTRHLPLVN